MKLMVPENSTSSVQVDFESDQESTKNRNRLLVTASAFIASMALATSANAKPYEHSPIPSGHKAKKEHVTRTSGTVQPFEQFDLTISPQHKVIGVAEDRIKQTDLDKTQSRVNLLASTGFGMLRQTVLWLPDRQTISGSEYTEVENSVEAAKKSNVEVCLNYVASTKEGLGPPATLSEQKKFAFFVGRVASLFPTVRCHIIFNEPNNPIFKWPQFSASDKDTAAQTYERVLARAYDALKAASPDNQVIGGELSSHGNDNPQAKRPSISPAKFIYDMGESYRKSGRKLPIMSAFSTHPYGKDSREQPLTVHPDDSKLMGVGDYPRLISTLDKAFPGQKLNVVYSEYGVESEIPDNQTWRYRGSESAAVSTLDQQGEFYRQYIDAVYCQPRVVKGALFLVFDQHKLRDWQSGVFFDTHDAKSLDAQAKPSANAVRDEITKLRNGDINCDAVNAQIQPAISSSKMNK